MRVVVTGAAGYLGRFLCHRLLAEPDIEEIVALDLRPCALLPPRSWLRQVQCDITTADLRPLFQGATAVFHLAFVLGSGGDDRRARRVDIGGTRRVLDAARAEKVPQVVVASSVSAYGALADNPPLLAEDAPLRADARYRYAWHKRLVERALSDFEKHQPEPVICRLRISVVLGPPPRPGAVTRVLNLPVLPLPRSLRVQFVHVGDVAGAFVLALRQQARGAFNVSAEPPLDGADLARITGRPLLPLPPALLDLASSTLGRLGVRDPGRLDFLRHPLLVDSQKIRRALGWIPRLSGPEALRELLAAP